MNLYIKNLKKIFYLDNFLSIYFYKAYLIDKKIFKINNFNIDFPTNKPRIDKKIIKSIINFDNSERSKIKLDLKKLGITKNLFVYMLEMKNT